MPTVSGDTLALPPSNSMPRVGLDRREHDLLLRLIPIRRREQGAAAVAYFLRVSDFMMTSFQIMSRVFTTVAGTFFGTKMPK